MERSNTQALIPSATVQVQQSRRVQTGRKSPLSVSIEQQMQLFESANGHEERRKIRKKLIKLGSSAAPYLLSYLQSKNDFTRWEVVSFLGEFANEKTMEPLIRFGLREDEVHARWRSFWAITRFDREKVIKTLLPQLQHKTFTRRWRAALILSMLEENEAGPILMEGLQSKDHWIQWEALNAIKSLKLVAAIEQVVLFTTIKTDNDLKREAVLALGSIGTDESLPPLQKCLGDSDPEVRWRASMALTKAYGSTVIPLLRIQLKKEQDLSVRQQLKSDIRCFGGQNEA